MRIHLPVAQVGSVCFGLFGRVIKREREKTSGRTSLCSSGYCSDIKDVMEEYQMYGWLDGWKSPKRMRRRNTRQGYIAQQ